MWVEKIGLSKGELWGIYLEKIPVAHFTNMD